jgi:drug/metabolite transporter (DMT)-like permease
MSRWMDAGLVYSAAIWGSTFFIVKDSLQYVDAVALVGYRFLLAAAILGAYLLYKKKNLFENFLPGLVMGTILFFLYVPQTIGLKYTTAANSGFITGLFVAFIPIFGLMFKRIPTRNQIIAVAVSVIGLWFLTGGLVGANFGDLITLIAAMTYALHVLFADRFLKACDPYILSFQQFFVTGVLGILTALIFGLPLAAQAQGVWIIIFLALFPSLSAFVIQLVAQKTESPLKVGLIFTLEPVFAAIFAWTLGGESVTYASAFGGLLIVAAMMLAEF